MTEAERMAKRRAEERAAAEKAKESGHAVTFISEEDGCEVSVTPDGKVFYNVGDWY